MSAVSLKHLCIGFTACMILAVAIPAHADGKHDYPKTGTVISITTNQGVVYKIDTGDKIYELRCIKSRIFQATPPQCAVSQRPIAVKDTLHFRLDEDEDETPTAYIPATGNNEEKLLVLSTELKVPTALPAAATSPSARQHCAVRGTGMDLVERPSYWVGETSPAIPFGPVTAIPVTGGPPVQVIATAPVGAGVITGVTTSGGAPVTAIPVAPISGASSTSTPTVIVETEWVPFMRVQTADYIYKLACESNPCWLKDRAPQLGDQLMIRVHERAYLSWLPPGPKGEQKFRILSMEDIDEPAAAPQR